MKKIAFLSLLAGAVCVGCSETDDLLEPQPVNEPTPKRLITVVTGETPLTDETGAPIEGTSRAAAITTETLSAFSMNYQSNKYKFSKGGSEWSTGPSWPDVDNDDVIDFHAYTGGDYNYNSGNPYLSFTVDENASTQHDLLVAKNSVSYSQEGGIVRLTFDHACAAVKFKIGQSNTLSSKSVTYTKIALVGVKNSGQYDYNEQTWKNLSKYLKGGASEVVYTLENASSIDIPKSAAKTHEGARELTCGYLFMLPQTLSEAIIQINYQLSGVNKTADIPLTGEWKAGHGYTINIRLGTSIIK